VGFAGFVSKDAVIESAFAGGPLIVFWMLVAGAAMTSFYSWRLMFLTFWGAPRGNPKTHDHAHESPMVMLIPLGVLALGAVFAGMIWYKPFFGSIEYVNDWFAGAIYMAEGNTVIEDAHHVPTWVKLAPFTAMLAGLGLAWLFYIQKPELPARLAESQRPLYLFLLNKWYFDELFDLIFVRPAKAIGRFLWKKGDGAVIDGGINGLALGVIPYFARLSMRAQTGYIFHYALAMVAGIIVLVTWMMLAYGGN
jgi:NADH-quinone oxidoreductase subunit L